MDATKYITSGNLITAKSAVVDMLDGKTFTINAVREQKFENKNKMVLSLEGTEQSLPLNISNSKTLVGAFGSETDNWKGKNFMLLVIKKEYKGKTVDGMVLKPMTGENGIQVPTSS